MRRAEEILCEAYATRGRIWREPHPDHPGATDLGEAVALAAIEQAQREAIEEAADWFVAAVERGYTPTRGECEHGFEDDEDCIACYDKALLAEVEALRALPHREGQ